MNIINRLAKGQKNIKRSAGATNSLRDIQDMFKDIDPSQMQELLSEMTSSMSGVKLPAGMDMEKIQL